MICCLTFPVGDTLPSTGKIFFYFEEPMADYTQQANEFIETLIAEGIDRKDIFTHFVPKGKQVVYPVLGDDGKPHLAKKTFR